jgi:hypothetical protein
MLVERAAQLPVSAALALHGLDEISQRELASFAADATSQGESLLERSRLKRPDDATPCHFGAQLGRPISRGANIVVQLRWWNEKSRSLTPGFIGELEVRPLDDHACELIIVGQYHPRAYLYELVDRKLLQRLANVVVSGVVEKFRDRLLAAVTDRPSEAQWIAS